MSMCAFQDFENSSLSYVRLSGVELRINLQITGKISLKLGL